ncbi:hypothetical protein B5X24_HaOG208783 [Helicoverpa armigera]|uniref:Uncharacterized protein n=1 Tax=Helicoverpa armigera TaxID=29058 RepID=A0A2W1BG90_HELAM|nr:hypothetical protein B5X24_HaOG208783 [Helicoverpa armigera]
MTGQNIERHPVQNKFIRSLGGRFARAEMGARLVQCTLAGGEAAAHVAALLRTLALPPDTTHTAQHKTAYVRKYASHPHETALAEHNAETLYGTKASALIISESLS